MDYHAHITFQDFEEAENKDQFLLHAVSSHVTSRLCTMARSADMYDRQMNETIHNYVQVMFSLSGTKLEDFTASNSKIASNFFNRLNTQRCSYSLGNGVSFVDPYGDDVTDGSMEDVTKEKLGKRFDHDLYEAGYNALKHGVSFCFWNLDRMHVFPLTEFVPLWDEYDGSLRAGIRFWRLDYDRPMTLVLYEEDGYTKYVTEGPEDRELHLKEAKKPYKYNVEYTPADGEVIVGEENYGRLPIVPMWGSRLKQSTLVGMRQEIDSYDLIRSGFANDLSDCAQIYWIVENCGGMSDKDLERLRDQMRITHIVNADTDGGGGVKPYAQEIPYQARKQYLDDIRSQIYEDFGGLDVHTVAAGATNDHIDAAYQPMDENADDFEYWVSEAVVQVLALIGIEDKPIFKRNRISNQLEQVQMIAQEAQWLDQQTILRKLPNITPDEIAAILQGTDSEDQGRLMSGFMQPTGDDEEEEEEEEPEE